MTAETIHRKTEALTAAADTDTLTGALRILADIDHLTADQRMARAWICEELEARHPEVTPALLAWVESDRPGNYASALLAALAEVA